MMDFKRCGRRADCCHPAGPELPSTEFYNRTASPDGMQSWCKTCYRVYSADRRTKARLRIALSREYYYTHRAAILARQRLYQRNRTSETRHHKTAESLDRRLHNRLKSAFWRLVNPEAVVVAIERRRARLHGLPDDWTVEQWRAAIGYFKGRCAVCGCTPDGQRKVLAADHWIPISGPRSGNPGTTPGNMVPLCHGAKGCNNSKSNKDALAWLTRKYGKTKGAQEYERVTEFLQIMADRFETPEQPQAWRSWLDSLIYWLSDTFGSTPA